MEAFLQNSTLLNEKDVVVWHNSTIDDQNL